MRQAGEESPDRNAQFEHINDTSKAYAEYENPVVSIDCKKKENIGKFKNEGARYCPTKDPTEALDPGFPLPDLGKAAPYGACGIAGNEGFVNVGDQCGYGAACGHFHAHVVEAKGE